jgi:hypothetical protein
MLNLFDTTSKIHAIAMFVTVRFLRYINNIYTVYYSDLMKNGKMGQIVQQA